MDPSNLALGISFLRLFFTFPYSSTKFIHSLIISSHIQLLATLKECILWKITYSLILILWYSSFTLLAFTRFCLSWLSSAGYYTLFFLPSHCFLRSNVLTDFLTTDDDYDCSALARTYLHEYTLIAVNQVASTSHHSRGQGQGRLSARVRYRRSD